MKAVMMSIQPKWCELIASGKKTIEVRKTRPKLETPFKCYIYETKAVDKSRVVIYVDSTDPCKYYKGSGKVIGEFNCYGIIEYDYNSDGYGIREEDRLCYLSCLTPKELYHYLQGGKCYGWCFDSLVIYDEPKELSNFYRPCPYEDNDDISCFLCDKSGRRPDDANLDCFYFCEKPPQSWYYVEEVQEDE